MSCVLILAAGTLGAEPIHEAGNSAETPPSSLASVKKPSMVKLGLYITSLYDLDMAKRSFNAVFWAWFESADDSYKPTDTVEVTNARNPVARYAYSVLQDPAPNSSDTPQRLSAAKYFVNIAQDWDIRYFPFDHQHLKIYFEDSQSDKSTLQFVADTHSSGVDDSVTIPGWTIEKFSLTVENSSYHSDFGLRTAKVPSIYSRVVADISIKRSGLRLLCNLYAGFFVAFLLISLTYFMEIHSMVGNRIGLCGSAIFASVGNKYILDNTLPLTSTFTLSDAIELSTFVAIVICIITALLVKKLADAHPKIAHGVNWVAGIGNVLSYVGIVGSVIVRAID